MARVQVVKRLEDGTLLLDMEEVKYESCFLYGDHLLVVIPPEVEKEEVFALNDRAFQKMPGCGDGNMQVRRCGGVERFVTRQGRKALKVKPGTTHLLVYGRVATPVYRVNWVEASKTMSDYWDADLIYNGRSNSIFVLRVAEIELLNLDIQ